MFRFPPFVSNSVSYTFLQPAIRPARSSNSQRHVTRQKILNWKQSLRFPSKPRVSHEGVNLMQQLLCEPEDRLGSQTSSSVNRPDALVAQARRSSFVPHFGSAGGNDGAEFIKVMHPLLPVLSVFKECSR